MKVLVAMSGGVDSSVAAYILKEQGYDVAGAYMNMLGGGIHESDKEDAGTVAGLIGIPFYRISAEDAFRNSVLDYFCDYYMRGLTPNPCVICNRDIKFGFFLKFAEENGFSMIATGHYASVYNDDGIYRLGKASDISKDQSYFMWHLSQHQLSKVIFPLNSIEKEEVRKIAGKIGLNVSDKKESQDICFCKKGEYLNFIENFTGKRQNSGNILDPYGNVIGTHDGILKFTVGQRKGAGVGFGKPQYVISKNASDNTVVMGDDDLLYSGTVYAKNIVINEFYREKFPMECSVKLRYSRLTYPGEAFLTEEDTLKIVLKAPARAVTPGQYAVLYDDNYVIGGGEIYSAEP